MSACRVKVSSVMRFFFLFFFFVWKTQGIGSRLQVLGVQKPGENVSFPPTRLDVASVIVKQR